MKSPTMHSGPPPAYSPDDRTDNPAIPDHDMSEIISSERPIELLSRRALNLQKVLSCYLLCIDYGVKPDGSHHAATHNADFVSRGHCLSLAKEFRDLGHSLGPDSGTPGAHRHAIDWIEQEITSPANEIEVPVDIATKKLLRFAANADGDAVYQGCIEDIARRHGNAEVVMKAQIDIAVVIHAVTPSADLVLRTQLKQGALGVMAHFSASREGWPRVMARKTRDSVIGAARGRNVTSELLSRSE